ncbi:MAG: hypothetical protein WCG85_13165 [Polyangia bacterium]
MSDKAMNRFFVFASPMVLLMFAAAAGCGGHGTASLHDAATDGITDARSADGASFDVRDGASDTESADVPSFDVRDGAGDTGSTGAPIFDARDGATNTGSADVPSVGASDGATDQGSADAPSPAGATDASDFDGASDSARNDDAPAADGPDVSPTSDSGPAILSVTVIAGQNQLTLDACNVTPAVLADIPAGTYTIQLAASTLSKGFVSGTPQLPAVDSYVLVNLPLGANDPQQDRRFFMLNGVGTTANVTLTTTGTIGLMFLDSDSGSNNGTATVTLTPGGYSTTVDAVANVLRWQEGCQSTPATLVVGSGAHRATLVTSTLSAGPGSHDDYVLLRLPSEQPTDDHRFVVLNGVGASYDFTPYNSQTVRAWFISASSGASGQATVEVSDL